MDLDLAGKTALITGGSKGIGLETAKVLAAEGVSLHLAARDPHTLEQARSAIRSGCGVDVSVYSVDLSRSEEISRLASSCADIDILVNNAGAIPGGTIRTVDEDTWRSGWDLKVYGYINLTRLIYAQMVERGSGVIVNVCGTAGDQPPSNHLPGIVANSALITLTRAMGGVSLDDGVRVVGINPGDMVNERGLMFMRRYAVEEFGDAERWEEAMAHLPGGKAAVDADMANAIAFLASPRAGYVSGVVLTIDGGVSARRAVI
ncbi:short-chain dehydrogenase/reductase [Aurantimonas sp. NFXS3]|uniref:short-chain dehydrogenase/reductase n=1 Tax=Aurantimonas sp. NFXS3 TaxID=2818434 RepID=UPI003B8C4247